MSLLSFSLKNAGILAVWSSDPYEDEILVFDTDDMESHQVGTLSIKRLEDEIQSQGDSTLVIGLNDKVFIVEPLLIKIRISRETINSNN